MKQQPKRTLQITIDSELLYEFKCYENASLAFEEFTNQALQWHELNLEDKELKSKIDLFESLNIFLLKGKNQSGEDLTFELSPEDQEHYGIDKDSYWDVEGYTRKEIIPDLELRKSILKTLDLMGLIDLTRVMEDATQREFEALLDYLVPQELITHIKTRYPNLDVEKQEAMKNVLYVYRLKD